MRDEFPIFKAHPQLIYLDSAATSHKPKCVIEALKRAYGEEYGTVHRAIYRASVKATEQYNETREYVRGFLNASEPSEIIFTRGTTDAINLVAMSYRTFLKQGDEILISEMEHHSNIVPWQMAADATGATLKWMKSDARGVLQWKGTIGPKTKLIALGHMSNVTGTINPIAEIAQEAKKFGAHFLVDGAQAAAHLEVDVQALGCDFYAFSGHKCYGPTGIGVLYGRRELLEKMPPVQGGGDMIEEVTLEKTTYREPPMRFEAGTPAIAEVIALKTALEFLVKHRREEGLLELATEKMLKIPGLRILGTAPEKGPIITFVIEGIHSLDLATMLDLKGVAIRSGHLCAQPALRHFGCTQAARVSFGIYNTKEEVERFIAILIQVTKSLSAPQ